MEEEHPAINVLDQERILMLPSLDGSEHAAQIVWIRQMEGEYYVASLRYIDPYPYKDGYTEWIIKLDKEVGFKPLICSLYWQEEAEKEAIDDATQV